MKFPYILVRFYIIAGITMGSMLTVSMNDLNSFTSAAKPFRYIGEYLTSINAYYYKQQNGDEVLIHDFLGTETQLYSNTSPVGSNINDYIMLKSQNDRYIVTIQKGVSKVLITQINSVSNVFSSATST